MTIKQYKFIKRFSKCISIFCLLAIFVETTTFLSIQNTKAEDACSGNIALSTTADMSNVGLNTNISFTATPSFGIMQMYTAQIWIKKTAASGYSGGLDIPEKYGEPINASGVITRNLSFNDLGTYEYYLSFTLDGQSCPSKDTNHLTVNVVSLGSASSVNVSVSAPDKLLRGQTATIKITVNGGKDQKIDLWINKGGTGCPDTSTSTDCWIKKLESEIDQDSWYHETDWTPDSSSNLGNHAVKAKVYDRSIASHPLTGMDTVYINVCESGTDIDSCSSGTSSGTGGGSGSTAGGSGGGTVTVPDEIPITIGGSAFKFTLYRGSGIGGLLLLLINLLLSLIGAFAFISMMVAGLQYVTASGDAGKTDKAKRTIIYSSIAIFLATFSLIIVRLINKIAAQ